MTPICRVAPSQSVRETGDPPDFHRFARAELADAVAEHALALAKEMATVAVFAIVLIALALPTDYALTISQMLELLIGVLMGVVQVIIGLLFASCICRHT